VRDEKEKTDPEGKERPRDDTIAGESDGSALRRVDSTGPQPKQGTNLPGELTGTQKSRKIGHYDEKKEPI